MTETVLEKVLLAAQEWHAARKEYLEKEGKTQPGDLVRLGNAEAALARAVRG